MMIQLKSRQQEDKGNFLKNNKRQNNTISLLLLAYM